MGQLPQLERLLSPRSPVELPCQRFRLQPMTCSYTTVRPDELRNKQIKLGAHRICSSGKSVGRDGVDFVTPALARRCLPPGVRPEVKALLVQR